VRRGETLAQIADRYGVTLGELKRVNGLSRNAVPVGRRLRLQEGAAAGTSKAKVVKATKKRSVKPVRKR
jgi:LysM repeat protein